MSIAAFDHDGDVRVVEWPRVALAAGTQAAATNALQQLGRDLLQVAQRCADDTPDSARRGAAGDARGSFDGLADGELSAVVLELVGLRERLSALAAEAGDVWTRRRLWALDGSRSAGHCLARDANLSVAAAKRLLAAGRARVEMPVVAASWAEGRLSAEHVALFADARTGREALLERDEQYLVEQAEQLRFAETKKLIDYWKLRADAELDPDGPRPVCTPAATVATTYDGVVHVTATLDPTGGAVFAESLARIEHEIAVADREAGRVRSKAERNRRGAGRDGQACACGAVGRSCP